MLGMRAKIEILNKLNNVAEKPQRLAEFKRNNSVAMVTGVFQAIAILETVFDCGLPGHTDDVYSSCDWWCK